MFFKEKEMGCRYACICSGFCPDCSGREPESYFGEAEDIYDKVYGLHDSSSFMEPSIDDYRDDYLEDLEEEMIDEQQ